jgi:hypothetical protein
MEIKKSGPAAFHATRLIGMTLLILEIPLVPRAFAASIRLGNTNGGLMVTSCQGRWHGD